MSADTGQLPLALRLDHHASFESFVSEGNSAAVAHLKAVAEGARRDLIWLWGSSGSGRSHLLQACCRAASAAGKRAMYLSLDPAAMTSEVLANLGSIDLLAIDEIDRVAGDPAWEAALFSVLNSRYSGAGGLLMAADSSPAAVPFSLQDLASRASGAVVYRLKTLTDAARLQALMRHAAIGGLEIDAPTAAYLFTRVKRDMRALILWLERIDRAALVAQRRITIPFVRSLLQTKADDSS